MQIGSNPSCLRYQWTWKVSWKMCESIYWVPVLWWWLPPRIYPSRSRNPNSPRRCRVESLAIDLPTCNPPSDESIRSHHRELHSIMGDIEGNRTSIRDLGWIWHPHIPWQHSHTRGRMWICTLWVPILHISNCMYSLRSTWSHWNLFESYIFISWL